MSGQAIGASDENRSDVSGALAESGVADDSCAALVPVGTEARTGIAGGPRAVPVPARVEARGGAASAESASSAASAPPSGELSTSTREVAGGSLADPAESAPRAVGARSREASRLARAAFSRLAEPQDAVAAALIAVAGPVDALRVATGAVRSCVRLERAVAEELGRDDGGPAVVASAVERWAARVRTLAPERDVAVLARLGGWLLTPEDDAWPVSLADLGPEAPLCLWGRGWPPSALPESSRAVAVVGARDSTAYGESVSADLAHGLVLAGCTVVSGGAFGIDAQAHRGALAAHQRDTTHPGSPWRAGLPETHGGDVDGPQEAADAVTRGSAVPTVAVMACGVDRFYPAAHESLLRAVMADGCLLAEVPPGSSPTRWRFLQRNRLIAALSGVTVVVEARWRSGALNTAHHAAGLGREVGAVPGSVHAATSAGCHRLLRESEAVCVTDVDDVLGLLAPYRVTVQQSGRRDTASAATPSQSDVVVAPSGSGGAGRTGDRGSGETSVRTARPAAHDGLSPQDLILFDALPVRRGATTAGLASVAGLSEPLVRAGLGRLSLRGLAVAADGGWRKGGSVSG